MNDGVARAVATVLGLGERLPAPGTTAGSLPAALVFAALAWLLPAHLPAIALAGGLLLAPLSVWAAGRECRRCGLTDPGSVVIDEVAGQWVALAILSLFPPSPPGLIAILAAFVLFRVLDVVKPWPIGALERLPGGWGVCLDDLAAGLVAGVAVAATRGLVG